ncbi:MAG: MobF family relaxase, partial [Verrucomicrobiales bacterium]
GQVALRELETFASTRVRQSGQDSDRPTGNLVAAQFTHTTSRKLDPQLHTHFTVFTATYDSTEKRWKALQAGAMYDATRYATAVYRNELARRVQGLGYRTERAEIAWEITGVSKEIRDRFSKRSALRDALVLEVEERLVRKLSNNEISNVVHWSREKKITGISAAEARARHQAELPGNELLGLRELYQAASGPRSAPPAGEEKQALDFALTHVFERRSVVPEHELLAIALADRPGELELPKLKQALHDSPELIATPQGYSTRQILKAELGLIAAVEDGKSAVAPLHPAFEPADWLGADQKAALCQVLQSADRITGFRGLAGTGKTTVLKELKAAADQAGCALRFCAPTAAATDVLRKEGFAAVTLESLLREAGPNLTGSQAVVLDEAGAVNVDDMARLLRLGSRVILSGDTGQHGSVKRGDALRIIEDHSPYGFGRLTQIRRQRRADYRRVVELAARKETPSAFKELERLDCITESSEAHLEAAQAYLSARRCHKSALLVAPTWGEIEKVTVQVRTGLKADGLLGPQDHEFRVFDSMSWTEAQKRDLHQYRPGQVLRFHQAEGGFRRDEAVEVTRVAGDGLQVRRKNGSEKILKIPEQAISFDVGEAKTLKVATGDKLLLQANWRKCFTNGELVEVKAIASGEIQLTDGRLIRPGYNTFTHGYALTSHAAQGKTVDSIFLVATARSLPAVHREQFYVSVSRGRDECRVFTDDKELLRRHVTRSSTRLAAVEAIKGTPKPATTTFARKVAHRAAPTAQRLRQFVAPARTLQSVGRRLPTPRHDRAQGIRL